MKRLEKERELNRIKKSFKTKFLCKEILCLFKKILSFTIMFPCRYDYIVVNGEILKVRTIIIHGRLIFKFTRMLHSVVYKNL